MPDSQAISAPPAARSTTWIIVALAIALAAVALVAWLRPGRSAGGTGEQGVSAVPTLVLETFVVNLKGDERAYLRVGVTLALSRPQPKEKNGSGAVVALARDTILDLLTEERAGDLLQPEGKRQLKTRILDALRQRAPELGVQDVYFTEFLVQM